jgi:cation diffusion facilitator CzcD-associated flavoprotein CzcO
LQGVEDAHVHDVAIVGAGFGGLGMAIRLKQEGLDDFVLIERGDDVGGTWWANSYPGCQCDIPSNLYSFSFAYNPDWDRAYPMRDQILEYLRDSTERFGVLPHVRLRTELLAATWVADAQHWELETTTGPLTARVLVAAPGLLSEPSSPALPGLERFEGNAFHTAEWDHSDDLTGKRVALLGTGATGVQVVPEIQPRVAKLHLFQRTPPWVIPHTDHPVADAIRQLYRRIPLMQKLSRGTVYALRESVAIGITRDRRWLKGMELNARLHLRRQVPDPELRRQLTPDYEIFCKRIILSSRWYPAIQAQNVDIVGSGVAEVREHSVVDGDGAEREIDTLIFATGFKPAELPIAERIHGRDGSSLAEVWNGSPEAYLGTTVTGFPNLLFLYGPNLNLGHSSIVYMLESQLAYAMDALRTMRLRDAAEFEVRSQVQAAYNQELQERLAETVWNTGGCGSWYFDRNGRNSIQWPGFTFEYRRRTRRFDAESYRLAPALVGGGSERVAPAVAT